MSAFGDLDDEMQDALDGAYAEEMSISPQGERGWRGQAGFDPGRPAKSFRGRYRSKPIVVELEGNREGSRFQSMTRVSARTHMVRISPAEIMALGYAPAAGDTVILTDRIDRPAFTISNVGLRDSGEIQIELVSGAAP